MCGVLSEQSGRKPVKSPEEKARLSTVKDGSNEPQPLVRAMTLEEVQIRAQKVKKEVKMPDARCGMAAAMQERDVQLELAGKESSAAKKKRKREEAAGDKAAALKLVKGNHLLK
eukprot:Skav236619  [mRNA]  locus=scaffold1476:319574:322596:- [translate_table: standard]